MKKFNYSLARERVEFATSVVKFVTANIALVTAIHALLGVAFNYAWTHQYAK